VAPPPRIRYTARPAASWPRPSVLKGTLKTFNAVKGTLKTFDAVRGTLKTFNALKGTLKTFNVLRGTFKASVRPSGHWPV